MSTPAYSTGATSNLCNLWKISESQNGPFSTDAQNTKLTFTPSFILLVNAANLHEKNIYIQNFRLCEFLLKWLDFACNTKCFRTFRPVNRLMAVHKYCAFWRIGGEFVQSLCISLLQCGSDFMLIVSKLDQPKVKYILNPNAWSSLVSTQVCQNICCCIQSWIHDTKQVKVYMLGMRLPSICIIVYVSVMLHYHYLNNLCLTNMMVVVWKQASLSLCLSYSVSKTISVPVSLHLLWSSRGYDDTRTVRKYYWHFLVTLYSKVSFVNTS